MNEFDYPGRLYPKDLPELAVYRNRITDADIERALRQSAKHRGRNSGAAAVAEIRYDGQWCPLKTLTADKQLQIKDWWKQRTRINDELDYERWLAGGGAASPIPAGVPRGAVVVLVDTEIFSETRLRLPWQLKPVLAFDDPAIHTRADCRAEVRREKGGRFFGAVYRTADDPRRKDELVHEIAASGAGEALRLAAAALRQRLLESGAVGCRVHDGFKPENSHDLVLPEMATGNPRTMVVHTGYAPGGRMPARLWLDFDDADVPCLFRSIPPAAEGRVLLNDRTHAEPYRYEWRLGRQKINGTAADLEATISAAAEAIRTAWTAKTGHAADAEVSIVHDRHWRQTAIDLRPNLNVIVRDGEAPHSYVLEASEGHGFPYPADGFRPVVADGTVQTFPAEPAKRKDDSDAVQYPSRWRWEFADGRVIEGEAGELLGFLKMQPAIKQVLQGKAEIPPELIRSDSGLAAAAAAVRKAHGGCCANRDYMDMTEKHLAARREHREKVLAETRRQAAAERKRPVVEQSIARNAGRIKDGNKHQDVALAGDEIYCAPEWGDRRLTVKAGRPAALYLHSMRGDCETAVRNTGKAVLRVLEYSLTDDEYAERAVAELPPNGRISLKWRSEPGWTPAEPSVRRCHGEIQLADDFTDFQQEWIDSGTIVSNHDYAGGDYHVWLPDGQAAGATAYLYNRRYKDEDKYEPGRIIVYGGSRADSPVIKTLKQGMSVMFRFKRGKWQATEDWEHPDTPRYRVRLFPAGYGDDAVEGSSATAALAAKARRRAGKRGAPLEAWVWRFGRWRHVPGRDINRTGQNDAAVAAAVNRRLHPDGRDEPFSDELPPHLFRAYPAHCRHLSCYSWNGEPDRSALQDIALETLRLDEWDFKVEYWHEGGWRRHDKFNPAAYLAGQQCSGTSWTSDPDARHGFDDIADLAERHTGDMRIDFPAEMEARPGPELRIAARDIRASHMDLAAEMLPLDLAETPAGRHHDKGEVRVTVRRFTDGRPFRLLRARRNSEQERQGCIYLNELADAVRYGIRWSGEYEQPGDVQHVGVLPAGEPVPWERLMAEAAHIVRSRTYSEYSDECAVHGRYDLELEPTTED